MCTTEIGFAVNTLIPWNTLVSVSCWHLLRSFFPCVYWQYVLDAASDLVCLCYIPCDGRHLPTWRRHPIIGYTSFSACARLRRWHVMSFIFRCCIISSRRLGRVVYNGSAHSISTNKFTFNKYYTTIIIQSWVFDI